jgi:hypothetical protein
VPLVGSIIILFITNWKVKLLIDGRKRYFEISVEHVIMDKSITHTYIYIHSLVADLIDRWRLLPLTTLGSTIGSKNRVQSINRWR